MLVNRANVVDMKTTAMKNPQGQPIYVGGGAVAQDGSLKLYTCNTCHHEVVWATSARTGRVYLVNVRRGYLDQRYYVKASAHRCQPAENPEVAQLRTAVAEWDIAIEKARDERDANDDPARDADMRGLIRVMRDARRGLQDRLDELTS